MARRLIGTLAGVLLLVAAQAVSARPALVFGVYPYLAAGEIVRQYGPLRDYLARVLGRPVIMVSAPDFPAFIERTRTGAYDIVFTAPHMGRLAEVRDGWRRVVQTGFRMEIVVLSAKDSPIRQLEDLRGRSVALGSRGSMTYQIVNRALQEKGLALERDVAVVETASFSNVLQAVVHRQADGGATGLNLFEAAPAGEQALLRLVFRAPPSPGFVIMAGRRLSDDEVRVLREALMVFNETPAGADYFRSTRQIDFRPLDEATMRSIDPFTAALTERP